MLNQINVASGTRATLIPDVQGSFIGALDASSGALTKYGYQTYGESGSTGGSFRYTGQRIDPETNGLYYYRARMYAPAWGRFMQVDPIGMKFLLASSTPDQPNGQTTQQSSTASAPSAGLVAASTTGLAGSNVPSAFSYVAAENLYGYVGNDPINNIDPNGKDLIGAAVGLVSGAYYGAAGAYFTPGSTWQSVLAGGIVGGAVGGTIGLADLTAGVYTESIIGSVAGAAGDIAGQVLTNAISGNPLGNINWGSTAGAAVGGAIGGGGSTVLNSFAPGANFLTQLGISSITSGPGVITTAIGSELGNSMSASPSLDSSPTK